MCTVVKFYSKSADKGDLDAALGNWRQYLSNFAVCPTPIVVDIAAVAGQHLSPQKLTFPSVEHGFHALKYTYTSRADVALRFQDLHNVPTPLEAKRLGSKKQMKMRYQTALRMSDWNQVRVAVMETLIRARFEQDQRFRDILRAVHAKGWTLVHHERGGDKAFWGNRHNALGKILMEYARK